MGIPQNKLKQRKHKKQSKFTAAAMYGKHFRRLSPKRKNDTFKDFTFAHPIMQSMAICKHHFVEVAGLMLNMQHFPF